MLLLPFSAHIKLQTSDTRQNKRKRACRRRIKMNPGDEYSCQRIKFYVRTFVTAVDIFKNGQHLLTSCQDAELKPNYPGCECEPSFFFFMSFGATFCTVTMGMQSSRTMFLSKHKLAQSQEDAANIPSRHPRLATSFDSSQNRQYSTTNVVFLSLSLHFP